MKPGRRDRARGPIKRLAVPVRRPPEQPKRGWRVEVVRRWTRKAKTK